MVDRRSKDSCVSGLVCSETSGVEREHCLASAGSHAVPRPWSWMGKAVLLFPALALGVYASDLHKLLLNLMPALWGQPQKFARYGRPLDMFFCGLIIALCVVVVIARRFKIHRFEALPVLSQLSLAAFLTLSLVLHYNELSLEHYSRFIGGNLLLFLAPLLLCWRVSYVRLVWRIWVAMSLTLALVGVWFLLQGLMWRSARAELIPGTVVRMGHVCAVSVIYLLILARRESKLRTLLRFCLLSLLLFGILSSGAKVAYLLLGCVVLVVGVGRFLPLGRVKLSEIAVFVVLLLLATGMLVYICRSEKAGFASSSFQIDSYRKSIESRTPLLRHYAALGLERPILGHGIAASYRQESVGLPRAHSVSLALFVQTGVVGLTCYLLFVFSVIVGGIYLVKRRGGDPVLAKLALATLLAVCYLVLKAEFSGDVPGNRELWLFSGLLLSLGANLRGGYPHPRGCAGGNSSGSREM